MMFTVSLCWRVLCWLWLWHGHTHFALLLYIVTTDGQIFVLVIWMWRMSTAWQNSAAASSCVSYNTRLCIRCVFKWLKISQWLNIYWNLVTVLIRSLGLYTRCDKKSGGGFSTNSRIFFLVYKLFFLLLNVLNHFIHLLRRMSRDRNVYCPPLK